MNYTKLVFVLIISVIFGCTGQKKEEVLEIGFGKADLTQAGIFEDPVPDFQESVTEDKFRREEKFAISDRVEGRWRPGSGGIRKLADSIFVTAMYGEDKEGPWTIVTLDQVTLDFEEVDMLIYPLINELGLTKERIVILPSHSHATPPLDTVIYQRAVLEAVKQARAGRSEVEVASLNLQLDGKKYLINRRVHVDGIGSRTVMFNDGCIIHDDYLDATGHIHDWVENLGVDSGIYLEKDRKYITDGELDSKLQTIFIRSKKTGEMMGSFTRFAAHSVIVSAKVVNGDVSADFPGHLKRKLEKQLGGIALFGQGPSGDLRPLNKEYSHAFAKEYGCRLADEIIQAYSSMNWQPLTRLEFFNEPVEIPLIDNIFLSGDELEAEMIHGEKLFDKETNPEERRKLQNKFWGLYRIPWVHRMVRPEWKQQGQLGLNLYALRLNDQVLLATQGEIFNRIGKQMVEPYKEYNPVLVTIANEYVSYLPTDEERLKGGYESSVSIMTPGSPDLLIRSAHKLLDRIYSVSMNINKVSCETEEKNAFKKGIARKSILPGEINGLATFCMELAGGDVYEFQPEEKKLRILLFTNGAGSISQGDLSIPVQELTLFIPGIHQEFSIDCGKENLSYLEIVMNLTEQDMETLNSQQGVLPYYIEYAECKKYSESIKSEKTISRMILNEDIVPRLCIGSVETSGPDEVAAHTHPMLDQLFFGLSGNDCMVMADNAESRFLENDLLHIPLGSMHGVSVEAGKHLHYIWIDLFHSEEEMGYMKDTHIIIDE